MLALLRIAALLLLATFALAGCGVRGPLEPPPSAVVGDGQGDAGAPPAHKPFVLDPIL